MWVPPKAVDNRRARAPGRPARQPRQEDYQHRRWRWRLVLRGSGPVISYGFRVGRLRIQVRRRPKWAGGHLLPYPGQLVAERDQLPACQEAGPSSCRIGADGQTTIWPYRPIRSASSGYVVRHFPVELGRLDRDGDTLEVEEHNPTPANAQVTAWMQRWGVPRHAGWHAGTLFCDDRDHESPTGYPFAPGRLWRRTKDGHVPTRSWPSWELAPSTFGRTSLASTPPSASSVQACRPRRTRPQGRGSGIDVTADGGAPARRLRRCPPLLRRPCRRSAGA